jgi:hypothetical protein
MTMATATRGRLTSATITLHHPLDYYFSLFLRQEDRGLEASDTERPRKSLSLPATLAD